MTMIGPWSIARKVSAYQFWLSQNASTNPRTGQLVRATLLRLSNSNDDTEERLSARILVEEHRLYPAAIAKVLSGGWRIDGRRVVPI